MTPTGQKHLVIGRLVTATAVAADPGHCVLLDIRDPSEYPAGHAPGAVDIPHGVIEFEVRAHPALGCAKAPAEVDRDRPIVLDSCVDQRAALAAGALQGMGFRNVRAIAGGMMAWTDAGLPVVIP